VESVFNLLANQSRIPRLSKLWIAPFNLQRNLIDMIDKLALASLQKKPGRIVLKMNSLTDEKLMEALVRAGKAGVEVDLIIRGACMLPAEKPGVTDNIRVRSIIGRFLEHSRVFYFRSGNEENLYLSSADWMNRNMLRRVEVAWPIEDPQLRQRVVNECLIAYLGDNADAWLMQPDGQYVRSPHPKTRANAKKPVQPHSAQQALIALYSHRS
jgi:polyphosphate kinase